MATKRVKGLYVATASQFDLDTEQVPGVAFPSAGKATAFVAEAQKSVQRIAAKHLGITSPDTEGMNDEEKKAALTEYRKKLAAIPQVFPIDVVIQRLDENGQPDGDPIEFETYRGESGDDSE